MFVLFLLFVLLLVCCCVCVCVAVAVAVAAVFSFNCVFDMYFLLLWWLHVLTPSFIRRPYRKQQQL